MTIASVPETRLVRLGYGDPDPRRAVRIVNLVAHQYLAKPLDERIQSSQRAARWLDERIEQTTEQLERVEG